MSSQAPLLLITIIPVLLLMREPPRFPPPPSYPTYIPSHLHTLTIFSTLILLHSCNALRDAPAAVPLPSAPYSSSYTYPPAPSAAPYQSRLPSVTITHLIRLLTAEPMTFGSFSNLHHQDWSSVNLIPLKRIFIVNIRLSVPVPMPKFKFTVRSTP